MKHRTAEPTTPWGEIAKLSEADAKELAVGLIGLLYLFKGMASTAVAVVRSMPDLATNEARKPILFAADFIDNLAKKLNEEEIMSN